MTDTAAEALSLDEAAGRLGVTAQVASRYIRQGYVRKGYPPVRLPARRDGRHYRVRPEDLDAFLAAKDATDNADLA